MSIKQSINQSNKKTKVSDNKDTWQPVLDLTDQELALMPLETLIPVTQMYSNQESVFILAGTSSHQFVTTVTV